MQAPAATILPFARPVVAVPAAVLEDNATWTFDGLCGHDLLSNVGTDDKQQPLQAIIVARAMVWLRRWVALGLHSGRVRAGMESAVLMDEPEAIHVLTRAPADPLAMDILQRELDGLDRRFRAGLVASADTDDCGTRFAELVADLHLDPVSIDVLSLLLSVALDPTIARLLRFATGRSSVSLSFLVQMLEVPPESVLTLLNGDHPLRALGVILLDDNATASALARTLTLSGPALVHLLGGSAHALPLGVEVLTDTLDVLCVEPITLRRFRRSTTMGGTPLVIAYGEDAFDVTHVVSSLAGQLGACVVRLDGALLASAASPAQLLARTFLEATTRRGVVHITDLDAVMKSAVGPRFLRLLREGVHAAPVATFLSARQRHEDLVSALPSAAVVRVAAPSLPTRRTYWDHVMADAPVVPLDVDTLLATYPLSPGEMRRVRAHCQESVLGMRRGHRLGAIEVQRLVERVVMLRF